MIKMAVKLGIGFLSAFFAVLVLMPYFIRWLKQKRMNQKVSEYSLQAYKDKEKTPIMGGVLFILVPVAVTLLGLRGLWKEPALPLLMLVFAGFGLIGFIDDWLIVTHGDNTGLKPWHKIALQIAAAVFFILSMGGNLPHEVHIPFTAVSLPFGTVYILLAVFMFTGSSNAVNLTDGMDGLAAGCSILACAAFLVIACVQGEYAIAFFIAALIGALFGYLHFNVKPARIFMGDTGSLALGALLAGLAILLHCEIAYIVIGGIFVIETICVILQQVSVRTGHGRIFSYTPIHYAFVIKGMREKQVVYLFWLAEAILAAVGLWIGLH